MNSGIIAGGGSLRPIRTFAEHTSPNRHCDLSRCRLWLVYPDGRILCRWRLAGTRWRHWPTRRSSRHRYQMVEVDPAAVLPLLTEYGGTLASVEAVIAANL